MGLIHYYSTAHAHAPHHTLAQTVRTCLSQNSPPYIHAGSVSQWIIHPQVLIWVSCHLILLFRPPSGPCPNLGHHWACTTRAASPLKLLLIFHASSNLHWLWHAICSSQNQKKKKILAGEYIDFTELPQAKGKALRPSTLSPSEGSLLRINSACRPTPTKTIHPRSRCVDSVLCHASHASNTLTI